VNSYKFKGKVTVYGVRKSSDGNGYQEGQLAPGTPAEGTNEEREVSVFSNDPAVAALAIVAQSLLQTHWAEDGSLKPEAGKKVLEALKGLELGQVEIDPPKLQSTEVVAPPPKWPVQPG